MKVKVLQPIPEKGKLFDFKKEKKGLKSATTYDASNDYAVIISGGYDNENNWERYWNDCSAIYSALVDVYDYSPSHIYVIMSDGTSSGLDRVLDVTYDALGNPTYIRDSSPLDLDGNGTNDIQYSATKSNVSSVFNTLSNILDEDDHLFVYVTDHGGQTSGDDVYLYLWGETMTDDEFATELDKVNAGKITVTMEQCNSGGFIDDISANGRIISTACLASEQSSALANLTYNEYVYHWTSAVVGETPEGTPVDADANNDGWVSMREAFEYANTHDTKPEHPQYSSTPAGLGCLVRLSDNWNWSITDPSIVCTSGGTFTLHDRPAGTNVTWGHSNNLSYVSGQGTNSYKVKASGAYTSGEGWVQAAISVSGYDPVTVRSDDFWVGRPNNIGMELDGYSPIGVHTDHLCPNLISIIVATHPNEPQQGVTSYNWNAGSWQPYVLNSSGNNLVLNLQYQAPSPQYIEVSVSNQCGSSYSTSKQFWMGCSQYSITVSPNPSNGEVTVLLTSNDKTKGVNALQRQQDKWTITVYNVNRSSEKLRAVPMINNKLTLNTSGWPKGIYIIRARSRDKVLETKLVVE